MKYSKCICANGVDGCVECEGGYCMKCDDDHKKLNRMMTVCVNNCNYNESATVFSPVTVCLGDGEGCPEPEYMVLDDRKCEPKPDHCVAHATKDEYCKSCKDDYFGVSNSYLMEDEYAGQGITDLILFYCAPYTASECLQPNYACYKRKGQKIMTYSNSGGVCPLGTTQDPTTGVCCHVDCIGGCDPTTWLCSSCTGTKSPSRDLIFFNGDSEIGEICYDCIANGLYSLYDDAALTHIIFCDQPICTFGKNVGTESKCFVPTVTVHCPTAFPIKYTETIPVYQYCVNESSCDFGTKLLMIYTSASGGVAEYCQQTMDGKCLPTDYNTMLLETTTFPPATYACTTSEDCLSNNNQIGIMVKGLGVGGPVFCLHGENTCPVDYPDLGYEKYNGVDMNFCYDDCVQNKKVFYPNAGDINDLRCAGEQEECDESTSVARTALLSTSPRICITFECEDPNNLQNKLVYFFDSILNEYELTCLLGATTCPGTYPNVGRIKTEDPMYKPNMCVDTNFVGGSYHLEGTEYVKIDNCALIKTPPPPPCVYPTTCMNEGDFILEVLSTEDWSAATPENNICSYCNQSGVGMHVNPQDFDRFCVTDVTACDALTPTVYRVYDFNLQPTSNYCSYCPLTGVYQGTKLLLDTDFVCIKPKLVGTNAACPDTYMRETLNSNKDNANFEDSLCSTCPTDRGTILMRSNGEILCITDLSVGECPSGYSWQVSSMDLPISGSQCVICDPNQRATRGAPVRIYDGVIGESTFTVYCYKNNGDCPNSYYWFHNETEEEKYDHCANCSIDVNLIYNNDNEICVNKSKLEGTHICPEGYYWETPGISEAEIDASELCSYCPSKRGIKVFIKDYSKTICLINSDGCPDNYYWEVRTLDEATPADICSECRNSSNLKFELLNGTILCLLDTRFCQTGYLLEVEDAGSSTGTQCSLCPSGSGVKLNTGLSTICLLGQTSCPSTHNSTQVDSITELDTGYCSICLGGVVYIRQSQYENRIICYEGTCPTDTIVDENRVCCPSECGTCNQATITCLTCSENHYKLVETFQGEIAADAECTNCSKDIGLIVNDGTNSYCVKGITECPSGYTLVSDMCLDYEPETQEKSNLGLYIAIGAGSAALVGSIAAIICYTARKKSAKKVLQLIRNF